jgi:peptidyl-prolyl cis-trans isomerase SurA
MKSRRRATALFALIVLFALLSASVASAELVNRIAAVVDEHVITLFEVEQAAGPMVQAFSSQPQFEGLSDVEKRERIGELKRRVLTELIEQKLLEAEVNRLGIPVDEREIDEYVDRIKKVNGLTTEQLAASLSTEGKTMAEFRNQVKNQILREQYVAFRLKNKIEVTEEDARAFYVQHQEEYLAERVVSLSEIRFAVPPEANEEQVTAARQRASEVYEKLVAGDDFAMLAKKHSAGPTASAGGSLGSWKLESELAPSYRKAAVTLKPGELASVYQDEKGFVILRCDSWDKSGYLPYEEVSGKIKLQLRKETAEREMKNLAKELFKKSFVDIKIDQF